MFKNTKINWALALVALLGFLVVFLFSQVERADAYQDNNTKHKVSQGEWFSLKAGMPRHEVEELLDGPGHAGQKHTRWYRWAYGSVKQIRVVVSYDHNKMQNAFLIAKKINGGSFDVPIEGIDYKQSTKEDTRPCATAGEWNRLNPKMTRHEVRVLMDTQGRKGEPQVRHWNVCPEYLKTGHTAAVYAWFKDQKVHRVYWIETSK